MRSLTVFSRFYVSTLCAWEIRFYHMALHMYILCTEHISSWSPGGGVRKFGLTLKGAKPLRLDKINLVRPHVRPDRGLRVGLCLVLVRVQQRVEARHAALAGDPAHAALALVLEGDNLIGAREVGVDEGVEHRPHHLGFGACEADAQQAAHRRARPVGAHQVAAADQRVLCVVRRHEHRRGLLLHGHAPRVEQDALRVLEPRRDGRLHHRLADHEEVLVHGVLQARPPVALARDPRSILIRGAGCGFGGHNLMSVFIFLVFSF